MIGSVLAGLGALALMGNPPRKRRRKAKRRNPATRRELSLGGVERHGEHVSITREHGAYIIRRHPSVGHKVESARTLTQARKIARELRRSAKSNPAKRRGKRRNPATAEGFDSRGTRYKLRKNLETREWMLVAYVNGKRHEGRTLYFPYDSVTSSAEARKDAENSLAQIVGAKANPRRRRKKS